jgi:tRNA modification GTPase
MKFTPPETIFALASAHGRAGVAVIRVSGPAALSSLQAFNGQKLFVPPAPRHATLCNLYAPSNSDDLIDRAVVIFFKSPASYTGEDVVEYHLHGGRAVIDATLAVLALQSGHRLAEPGEFTRRAFENGKLDLTEAEAVADLIDAETEAQRHQALAQMGGSLLRLYSGWTEDLKKILAHLEADLEFPDEDMPGGISDSIRPQVHTLRAAIAEHLNDNRRGEMLRDGIQIAIIGAPNAGKSSLVNALAQRDVAIVSEMAGTTRDVIEAHLDIGGYPVIIADTAGLRPDSIGDSPHDLIEGEGIRRALERAQSADLKILLFDGTSDAPDKHTQALFDDRSLVVINKADCLLPDQHEAVSKKLALHAKSIFVSARSGDGLKILLDEILVKISQMFGRNNDAPALTRSRHRFALQEALDCLDRSAAAPLPELMAEDIRLAVRALGRITGRVDVEDLLDIIFRDFCIGK